MTIAIVANAIAPYTHKLFEEYGRRSGRRIIVYQCTKREANRLWDLNEPEHYELVTLRGLSRPTEVGYVHFNPGIVAQLAKDKPDIIIVAGFTPTMCAAALYALATGRSFGIYFDGSRATDKGESSLPHGFLRRTLVPRATFGICPSAGNRDLLRFWGMAAERTKISPWLIPWDPPAELHSFAARRFDVILSGQLSERKNPAFLVAVLERLRERGHMLSVRITGHGPLRETIEPRLRACCSHVQFDGNLAQKDLAEAYNSARLLAFPTRLDAWGLVANEAALCGTPVLASPHAVSSEELVARFGLGIVCDLDIDRWCDAILDILSSEARWRSFMKRRDEALASFSLERAVSSFAEGIALGGQLRKPGWRGESLPVVAAE